MKLSTKMLHVMKFAVHLGICGPNGLFVAPLVVKGLNHVVEIIFVLKLRINCKLELVMHNYQLTHSTPFLIGLHVQNHAEVV